MTQQSPPHPPSETAEPATSAKLPPAPHKAKKPATPPLQRVVNLAILGIMVLAGYNYWSENGVPFVPNSSSSAPSETQETPAATVTRAPHPSDPRIEQLHVQDSINLLKNAFAGIRMDVGARIVSRGEGRAVFCGQTLTYREQTKTGWSEEKTQRLGDLATPYKKSISWGVSHARLGDVVELTIPKDLAQSNFFGSPAEAEKPVKRVVELLAATPELPQAGAMELRRYVIDGEAGYPQRCGDLAVFHLTLWDATGKLLFSSLGEKPVYLPLGSGSVPLGLELALQEMGPGAIYSVVIPPELLEPLAKNKAPEAPPAELEAQPYPNLTLPKGHVIIADLNFLRDMPLTTPAKPF